MIISKYGKQEAITAASEKQISGFGTDFIISKKAIQNGEGYWKRVYRLEAVNRRAIKEGHAVYFWSHLRSGGNHGTNWRRVDYDRRKDNYFPRVPTQKEIEGLDHAWPAIGWDRE